MKRHLRWLSALAVIGILLAGCGPGSSPSSAAAGVNGSAASGSAALGDDPFAEHVSLRVFMVEKANRPTDNDVTRALQEKLNLEFVWDLAPAANYEEKFNLVMASGDLPDVMIHETEPLLKYVGRGAFEPLDELIDQYAPNVKVVIDSNPTIRRDMQYNDGKLYYFPMIAAEQAERVYFMRKDWLDALELEPPKTLDDWVTVLTAFRDNDLNGNGLQDEIPFTIRGEWEYLDFYEAFGIDSEFFVEDGTILYGPYDSRMKDYLSYVNKLYREKLIDQEYITTDKAQWQQKLTGEEAGATYDWFTSLSKFPALVAQSNPEYDLIGVEPPMGPIGKIQTRHQIPLVRDVGAAVISVSSPHKERICRWFDYVFSEEGQLLTNFGIEGVHYTMENGVPTYTDAVLHDPDGVDPSEVLGAAGVGRDWPKVQSAESEKAIRSEESSRTVAVYRDLIIEGMPHLSFTDDEQSILTERMAEIETCTDEWVNKFIMGTEPLDQFETFTAQLEQMGIQEVLEIYNAAYQRYLA